MQLSTGDKPLKVARVILNKRTVVPLNSVVKVTGFTKMGDQPYTIESDHKSKVLIPRTLHGGDTQPVLCLLNISDRNIRIRRNQSIATAMEVDVLFTDIQAPKVENVKVGGADEGQKTDVPRHLQDLFDWSAKLLQSNEKCELAKLLTEFEDVFAKNDYDLAEFTAIEHAIPTGDAKPVKQRIRRTPTCFVEEEEAYLKNMLDAGVIQPSISE